MARATSTKFNKTKAALLIHLKESLKDGSTFFDYKQRAYTIKRVCWMIEEDELCAEFEDGVRVNVKIS